MRHSMHLLIGLMIAGLSFLGIHQPVTSTGEATAEPSAEATQTISIQLSGKIAFISETNSDTQIYIMNADGSNIRQLTHGNRFPWSPALSPDGGKIAFAAEVDKRYQIFTMNLDGTNEKQLTEDDTGQNGVSGIDWSSDGKQITYTHKISDDTDIQSYELFVMNADGTNHSKITSHSMELLLSPHWSPDRKEIVFESTGNSPDDLTKPVNSDVKAHLYIIDIDGSNLHRLTQRNHDELFPAWSPDGKSIVFLSGGQSASDFGLYHINPDGTNIEQITSVFYTMPTWSPDGKYLAAMFLETKDGKTVSNIYVMNADGSNPIKITDTDSLYRLPSWSK